MKYISTILQTIKAVCSSKEVWIRFMILMVAGFAGALIFSRNKTKTVPVPVGGQCDWLIQQNKELITFITSPRRYNRKAVDSLVQTDSIKKERAGFSDTTE